jgi:rRNA maturation protein Nop10
MMNSCPECGRDTFADSCPRCGADTEDPRPAKFSPDEEHGEYRRKLKRLEESETDDEEQP